jgi:hypothetical protein
LKGLRLDVRTFLAGFGIGTLICVATTVLLFAGMHRIAVRETEYTVTVKIKMPNGGTVASDKIAAWLNLANSLEARFETDPSLGEFDQFTYDNGYVDIYMSTVEPERVVDQILPMSRSVNPPSGSLIITRVAKTGIDEKRYDLKPAVPLCHECMHIS